MHGRLEGKAAVVTGGGTGIGAAIARAFAREGARVAIAGRRSTPIETVAKETGGLAVVADVADESQVAALMTACDRAFGRLDILVNNAAVRGPVQAVADMDIAGWEACMAINIRGVVLCTKHALALIKRQGGTIINISSISGFKGKATRAAYTASKFALNGITECVAQEVGVHGIRVNSICPGAVAGERFRTTAKIRAGVLGVDVDDLIRREYTDAAALHRLAEPTEVAEAAVFLASDAASAITGQHLVVDCGRAA